ncbi:MAG: type II toxin-antitoxin system VapC family toxin [Planctomycetota bacterium]|nr:type II toxin-antitoxin system VapC family toxin [Planctomycetota bacterium]
MIVVDASAFLEVLLQTPEAHVVGRRLFRPGETLMAPHLIDVEVAQVVRRYNSAGEIDDVRGREALADLLDMPLTRYPHGFLLHRVWELRHNVTAYEPCTSRWPKPWKSRW